MVERTPAHDERGQILILTALSMTVLLGVAALSIDVSFMYDKRNQLHAAADAAAKSVATEIHRRPGITAADMRAFAYQQVAAHGLTPGACGSTTAGVAGVCIQRPPSGTFSTEADYVEVRVEQVTNTFFANVIGWTSLTPGARVVAGPARSLNCLAMLGPGSLTLAMGSTLTLHGCNLADGGDLVVPPSSVITAPSVGVSVGGCGIVANCRPNAATPDDPLFSLQPPSPAPPHTCSAPLAVNADITITVANADDYYCGMQIDTAVVTFNPGVYYIAGPITAKNAASIVTVNGAAVLFYLAAPNGSFNLSASTSVTLNLSAPTAGTYLGILFYQDRGNMNPANLSNSLNAGVITLSGALYFPLADLTMKNNNGVSNDCAVIVAQTLSLSNNADLANTCAGFGGSPILTVSVAE